MSTYNITFESVIQTCGGKTWLWFPGRYGLRHGPYKNRQEAWEQYVRIARETYFVDDPEKPIVYKETPLQRPAPYVPPIDYTI